MAVLESAQEPSVDDKQRPSPDPDEQPIKQGPPPKSITLADPVATATRARKSGGAEMTPPEEEMHEGENIQEPLQSSSMDDDNEKPALSRTQSIAAKAKVKTEAAIRFARQAEHLSLLPHNNHDDWTDRTTAVEARFITPRDPVIETASGDRLPAVPLVEAQRLNQLKSEVLDLELEEAPIRGKRSSEIKRDRHQSSGSEEQKRLERANEARAEELHHEDTKDEIDHAKSSYESAEGTEYDAGGPEHASKGYGRTGVPLKTSAPPSRTNPLFPPLPLYGPPSLHRSLQCLFLRFTSFFLSLGFLAVIVLGSVFTSVPGIFRLVLARLTFRDLDAKRPFIVEERKRAAARKESEADWIKQRRRRASFSGTGDGDGEEDGRKIGEFIPTEGGKDPLLCDVAYYARRVGLDIEEFKVHTEDGFIITLWHVYNPVEYNAATREQRAPGKPEVFPDEAACDPSASPCGRRRKRDAPARYPVLLIHGLLQSSGAYCSNDDDSLAFYLAKSGYDVWLGNNRCGFHPEHTLLSYSDPRLWCFNIRQMGVLDLPALISRVLSETGFPKLGLVCHSQGTTETFVALAKEQRPDLGQRISVFCALAPAVYAGPLIEKMYFKFMRVISPSMFRVFFGIHAFIPFMMNMHSLLPGGIYGLLGYHIFSFLFNWSDTRWDRGLRDRMFRFAPVYVSAESMRWWLGRECFAKHKCILTTREESRKEDAEDAANARGDEQGSIGKRDESNSPQSSLSRSTGRSMQKSLQRPKGPSATSVADIDSDSDSDSDTDSNMHVKNHNDVGTGANLPRDVGRRAWYDANAPPMALWVAGSDQLVDGRRLLRRFERGREPHVRIVHAKVIPEYEHLDVLWAMDVIEQVGKEVRDVLWQTAERVQDVAVPRGCVARKG